MSLIPLSFKKILQSRAYTVFMLGTVDIKFAIYSTPQVGQAIQNQMANCPSQRPMTHDLMNSVFTGLDIKPLQIVINDVEDTVYFSKIYLEQTQGVEKSILNLDARPSDALIIALMHKLPIFATPDLLQKVIPITDI